jgi:hypothetical protein
LRELRMLTTLCVGNKVSIKLLLCRDAFGVGLVECPLLNLYGSITVLLSNSGGRSTSILKAGSLLACEHTVGVLKILHSPLHQ